MTRRSSAIPKEPKHTCPLIDNLIRQLEYDTANPDRLTYFKTCLEEIRSANAGLREWGSTIADLYTDLEEKHDSLDSRLREAKDELHDAITELTNFKKENESLQAQLDSAL